MAVLHLVSARAATVLMFLASSMLVVTSPLVLQAQVASSDTVTFDTAVGEDRVLNGEFPAGMLDWGTNAWFLSAPWQRLTTKSIGFNGAGPTSASVTLLVPRTLVQVDAYNGGGVPSSVSLACAGLPTRTVDVPVDAIVTIQTSWSATCSTVLFSSSNGWNTNFDNLVIGPVDGGASSGSFTFSGVAVANSTASSVTIAWTTSVPTTSQVAFGPTTAYGSTTPLDSTLRIAHSVTIDGLATGATYNYQVRGLDAANALAASANFTFVVQDARTSGIWSNVTDLPVVPVALDVLPNGSLLLLDDPTSSQQPLVLDPRTLARRTVALPSSLFCSAQSMLGDGRLIVVGGHGTSHLGITDTNIFDAVSNTWSRVANMRFPRWYPSTTLLGDGRLLALSGMIDNNAWADTPEVYNPSTNTWSALGVTTPDVHEIEYPLTFLAPNGQTVTIAVTNGHTNALDISRATWTALPTTPTLNGSAAQYAPGKLLLTGGGARNAASARAAATLDLTQFNPTWQTVPPMHFPRFDHNLTVLPDGSVLAIGGAERVTEYINTGTLPTELWNPASNTWTVLASVHQPRLYHSTSALLPDGRVVVGGGGSLPPNIDRRNIEFLSPPYLFKGPRPTISSAPATIGYGQTMSIGTPDAARIAKVSFIPVAAVTHTVDMNQRYLELAFRADAAALSVKAPGDANSAPPGTYMLFVLDSAGVPSVASIVRLSGPSRFDTSAPAIDLSLPSLNLRGSVTLRGTARDDVGVTDVQFLVGGNVVGHSTTGGQTFSITWDSTAVPDGSYSLVAQARDAAGNVASSPALTIVVANSAPPPTPTASPQPTAQPTSTPQPTRTPLPTPTRTPDQRTLGNTSIGAIVDSGDADGMNGSRITTGAQAVTTRTISVFVAGIDTSLTNRSYQVAIYSDDNGRPGTLVASSVSGTLVANSWNTLPVVANLQPSTSYWLMYNTNGRSSAVNNMRRDDAAPGSGAYSPNVIPFGSWPSTFGSANLGTWSWSMYVSY